MTPLSGKNIQYFGRKIANIRFFKCSAQAWSWSITILHTSLPTKLQFSKCSWWSWTDHCDTMASISYNRCMRVSIWQRGNFTVTIWSMTMFRLVERIGGEGVTKRDATRIVKRGRKGEGTRANKHDQISFSFLLAEVGQHRFHSGAITIGNNSKYGTAALWGLLMGAWLSRVVSQSAATPAVRSGRNLISTNGI